MIKLGVIGCGFIAQAKHLPYLTATEGGGIPGIKVVAVCDLVKELADAIAKRYTIPESYQNYEEMLEKSDMDAVAILTTGDHTSLCINSMNAGKHVFTEKPLCFSVEEAERIRKSQKRNNVVLQLGYMKRFDPGYEYALNEVKDIKGVTLIRAHKYMGQHLGGTEILNTLRFPLSKKTGFTGSLIRAEQDRAIFNQLGKTTREENRAYLSLVIAFGHTLDALRGLFGNPLKVLRTEIRLELSNQRRFSKGSTTSLLDFDSAICVCEQGRGSPMKWDEFIHAYSPEKNVRISFSHSWLKNRPSIVEVHEWKKEAVTRSIEGSYEEAFKREWIGFVECVEEGVEPRTSVDDGEMVVKICSAMIENYRSKCEVDL